MLDDEELNESTPVEPVETPEEDTDDTTQEETTTNGYITLEEFRAYTSVFSDDDLQQSYIDGAYKIINHYLGWDIKQKEYTLKFDGNGKYKLPLKKKNITELSSITINGIAKPITYFFIPDTEFDERIISTDGVFPKGTRNIEITFTAGYEEVPADIKIIALQIAGLIQTTDNNNIGITSKSFDASGSRIFIQNRKYDDYLIQISNYKVIG